MIVRLLVDGNIARSLVGDCPTAALELSSLRTDPVRFQGIPIVAQVRVTVE